MIRPATVLDSEQIIALAIEALSIDPYPELRINRRKVSLMVSKCLNSQSHFSWVAEHDGRLTGVLGALVNDLPFHEGRCASVVMWYAKTPGDGVAMMREFVDWCEAKPSIVMRAYTGERGADPRIAPLLRRLGFSNQLPFYFGLKTV